MADSASPTSGAPPKTKRSFFKKPSWKQKVDNADEDDPTAMFDGSKQTFSAVMEEQERAMIKKLQEQEERAREKELAAARQGKRRKLATDEEYHNEEDDHVSPGRDDRKKSRSGSPIESDVQPRMSRSQSKSNANSLSARYEAATQERKPAPKTTTVIDLGDSDPDDGISPIPEKTVKQAPESAPTDPDDDIDESDPELREIIRQTRRKNRLASEQQATQGTPPVGLGSQQDSSPGAARGASTPLSPPAPDPPVQILITSRIPDTKPLIVTRKLRQRLQEVRVAWCKRQGFDQEVSDSIFFTYKGRRLYDVATCRSLGLDVDSLGNVYMKGNPDWDENDSKVVVEATTQDLFEDDLREARRQHEPEPGPELESEPEPEQRKMKIIIKTKEYGDAKFTCGPDTTFDRLAISSLKRLELPTGKRAYLLFDGERLEPSGTMADLDDFEDGDALEMHFD